jgi:IS1 family transposase/lambda repressor-like predicted transcriptional regulator
MNKLPINKRIAIISALVEGCSLRSTSRMVGVSINTVTKLLVDVGTVCAQYQHRVMRNLNCQRLQIDEIWAFCYCKEKNVPAREHDTFGIGDVWTFAAIDADTKLVPSWMHGNRSYCDAKAFVQDVAERLAHRVQITTDGHRMYLDAMQAGFGADVDYAMLIKHFGNQGTNHDPATRYSPGECCGTEKHVVTGNPDEDHISTAYIERQNLSMRMGMRRFTRLTNAFSKKLENLCHAVALYFMHYNFVRKHMTLKTTPALQAGIADHQWTLEEIVNLAETQGSN